MIIYPAIDLLNKECVRLYQGDYQKSEQVANDPYLVAKNFLNEGATNLHVVDLNSAKDGGSHNFEIIKKLANIGLSVQTGGGIRSLSRIKECFLHGVDRVIIGSAAVSDEAFVEEAVRLYKDKIIVGIDAKNGIVRTSGWLKSANINYIELARKMEKLGVKTIIYTDISKDGTLEGVDIDGTKLLNDSVSLNIIASGGIGTIDDLNALKNINVHGAILGKSLYSKTIRLKNLKLINGGY